MLPKSVLLVDDDAFFQAVIGDGLRAAGYKVAVASDGLEAIRRVREAPPDFVLLDLIMPKLDGFRTCQVLKRHPQYRGIPVVLLTGLDPGALKLLDDPGAEARVPKRQADSTLKDILQTLRVLESAHLELQPIAENIPDRVERRIVHELVAERQHVLSLLAALGEGMVELDERGHVIYVNPAGLEVLERGEEEFLGAPGSHIFGPDHAPTIQRGLDEAHAGGKGSRVRLEVAYRSKTIGLILLAMRRPHGPPGSLILLRDLTDLSRRARSLQALAAVGQHILAKLDLGTVLQDIVTRTADLLAVGRCAVFRVEPAGGQLRLRCIQARGFAQRPAPEDGLPPGETIVGKALELGRPVSSGDLRPDPALRGSETQPTLMQPGDSGAVLAAPILLPDEAFGALTVYRPAGHEFTAEEVELVGWLAGFAAIAIQNARLYAETRQAYEDLRAAQERLVQAEKLRAVEEMAGGVAHDFNNTLGVILGQAQVLRMRSTDPQVCQALEVIEEAALGGADTVRRLVGFARQRSAAACAPVALDVLLREALEVTRPRWKDEAQRQGRPIEAVVSLDAVPPVWGDAAALREVLVNLIFNAVEAMPEGGRLTVGATRGGRRAGGQEIVEVFVRDTGVGMPAAVRRRAFDPALTTKEGRRTGLGLSLVSSVIAQHGGEVGLASEEGRGTTVTLCLPASATPGAAAPAEASRPAAARHGQILVVDDEPRLAHTLADLLRLQGHQPHAFSDPRRALEHLAREPVDLLFTDLGMPEMAGGELIRQARALKPDLPVVLVTGWSQQIDPAEARDLRVNAVLPKPFKAQDLAQVVATLLPSVGGGGAATSRGR